MLVLYAVVPAGAAPLPPGPCGEGLRTESDGSVAVVYEERDTEPGPDTQEVLAFGQVLMRIADEAVVLPMRYATVLADREALARVLAERSTAWSERIRRVEDHVEVLVHASEAGADDESPVPRTSGREYLLARAEQVRKRAGLVDGLSAALRGACSELRVLSSAQEARLACLVPRGRLAGLEARLAEWAGAVDGRRYRTTGPWPPFSFTEEVLEHER